MKWIGSWLTSRIALYAQHKTACLISKSRLQSQSNNANSGIHSYSVILRQPLDAYAKAATFPLFTTTPTSSDTCSNLYSLWNSSIGRQTSVRRRRSHTSTGTASKTTPSASNAPNIQIQTQIPASRIPFDAQSPQYTARAGYISFDF